MYTDYTVRKGDTLTSIAYWHKLMIDDILKINPQVTNADFIRTGWILKLPIAPPPPPPLPSPSHACDDSTLAPEGAPECEEEVVDVVHITGEPDFYVLTEQQTRCLREEVDQVSELMEELNRKLTDAVSAWYCKKLKDPQADCTCSRCVKDAWAAKAEEAGLLVRDSRPQPAAAPPLSSAKDLQGQLAALQEARDWYQRYTPSMKAGYQGHEDNWKALQQHKLKDLDAEIQQLRTQLAAQIRPAAAASATTAMGGVPDLKHGRGVGLERQRGVQTRTGIRVIEIILLGDPSRRLYIRELFRQAQRWNLRVPTRVMAGRPFNRQLAGDLIKDIKDAVGGARKAGPLGNLEFKLASWTSAKDNLLNALHQEVAWTSNQADAAPYAVSAEAHALRFAASASAGVNSWDPRAGNINIGLKGSAAFSLAEASVSMACFFPSQGGYQANISYRNALGEEVVHPLGIFRLSGKLELSCFIGVKAQAEAGAQLQYKPSERPAGATALLDTPTMEVGRSGNIGVKGEAFAGIQPGGALSGVLEWIEPDRQGTGQAVAGQANHSSSWSKLAEIKLEGNVALGIGGSGEFGISISKKRLAINCRGSLVFGPGAGGGFGTVVDLEQIGKVISLFCKTLAEVDYRYWLGVTPDAFSYMSASLYQFAVSPRDMANKNFEDGIDSVMFWWSKRQVSKIEAQNLAIYVLSCKGNKAMMIKGQLLPFSELPPETLGPMVYILSEGFIESFNEAQEEALVILLSEIRSWRHFIKVLEHCSPRAEKVRAMDSLERIEALLDWREQRTFNAFINDLAVHPKDNGAERVAWRPGSVWRKEGVLIAARRSGRFGNLA